MAAATEKKAAAPIKGPSIIIQLLLVLILTGAAIGTGWLTGLMMNGDPPTVGTGQQVNKDHDYDDEPGSDDAEKELHVFRMEPITTNLADPVDIWARMELALVFDETPNAAMAEQIHQDFLAYLRTVKSRQIEGASGYQHLKSDLEERARIRSEGHVKQVLVRTLLFE